MYVNYRMQPNIADFAPELSLRDGRLGLHLQAEGAGDFADAGEAGGGVVGRFVALDLLLFQTQPFGQFFLAQAGGDATLDQSLRRVIELQNGDG